MLVRRFGNIDPPVADHLIIFTCSRSEVAAVYDRVKFNQEIQALRQLSQANGPERYSLRLAIDLPHSVSLRAHERDESIEFSFFGKIVRVQPTPFGAMAFASPFSSEAEAKQFGDCLRLACQLLSVRKSIPVNIDAEPVPIMPTPHLLESFAPDARVVDGMAMETGYTIIPEHQLIHSYGELRGNVTYVLQHSYLTEALAEVERQPPKPMFRFDPSIDIACNFWSIACANLSQIVSTVNLVAAMEVLAAAAHVSGQREGAVRALIELRLPALQAAGYFVQAPSPSDFCKQLFRRRNELVHTGRSATPYELSLTAKEICRVLILGAIEEAYF